MITWTLLYGAGAVALAFRRRPPGVASVSLLLAFLGCVALDILVARH